MKLSEDDLLRRILDYAKLQGWLIVHYRPCKTAKGWRTPLQGDAGAPDLILARNSRVLLVELKSATGRATPDQVKWLQALGDHARLWKPKDWADILKELR